MAVLVEMTDWFDFRCSRRKLAGLLLLVFWCLCTREFRLKEEVVFTHTRYVESATESPRCWCHNYQWRLGNEATAVVVAAEEPLPPSAVQPAVRPSIVEVVAEEEEVSLPHRGGGNHLNASSITPPPRVTRNCRTQQEASSTIPVARKQFVHHATREETLPKGKGQAHEISECQIQVGG